MYDFGQLHQRFDRRWSRIGYPMEFLEAYKIVLEGRLGKVIDLQKERLGYRVSIGFLRKVT